MKVEKKKYLKKKKRVWFWFGKPRAANINKFCVLVRYKKEKLSHCELIRINIIV